MLHYRPLAPGSPSTRIASSGEVLRRGLWIPGVADAMIQAHHRATRDQNEGPAKRQKNAVFVRTDGTLLTAEWCLFPYRPFCVPIATYAPLLDAAIRHVVWRRCTGLRKNVAQADAHDRIRYAW